MIPLQSHDSLFVGRKEATKPHITESLSRPLGGETTLRSPKLTHVDPLFTSLFDFS